MVSYNDKISLINYFRSVAERELCSIVHSTHDCRKQASKINTIIKDQKDCIIDEMLKTARHSRWSNEYVLDCVLHITYASNCINSLSLDYQTKRLLHYHYVSTN